MTKARLECYSVPVCESETMISEGMICVSTATSEGFSATPELDLSTGWIF